jgi:hypothetical protein
VMKFSSLIRNRMWHLVPASHGRNLIDRKCVYKVKQKSKGTMDRYKARLVAIGLKQHVVSKTMTCLVLWSKLA